MQDIGYKERGIFSQNASILYHISFILYPAFTRTDILQLALRTMGLAGRADFTAEEDQAVVDVSPGLPGKEGHEFLFDHLGVGGRCQSQPEADAFDVGVHGNALLDAEGIGEHDIGGFPGHSPQGDQFFHGLRHFTLKVVHDGGGRMEEVFGLVFIKSRGVDNLFNLFPVGLCHGGHIGPACKEYGGDHINPLVRTLGGQGRGHQKFPRR